VSILGNLPSVQWRKSSYSDSSHGDCVEIAGFSQVIAVRDSKNPDGAVLTFNRSVFGTLAREIRTGRYDR
jgi:Domain of unknown function (DUF397)